MNIQIKWPVNYEGYICPTPGFIGVILDEYVYYEEDDYRKTVAEIILDLLSSGF